MRALIAVDGPPGSALVDGLEREGVTVVAAVAASALALLADDAALGSDGERAARALAESDVVVLQTSRATLNASVVALCDRRAVRIVPLTGGPADDRVSAAFGLEAALPLDTPAWQLADVLSSPPADRPHARPAEQDVAPRTPRVIAVWGPAGAPGRSTIAIELSVELARGGRHVGLVDADSHAPSIALALGLADEAPGFAAACRQSELGGLDARELTRIAAPMGRTGVEVLTGVNRPSRWPELSESRVAGALNACRDWADYTVVDVAASLERDEEIVSDLDGPRRNAATLAALRSADLVVAVAAADPLGISRFLRAYPDLRATIGATPVAVVANRLRPAALGIDARGQVRRTLDRFGGIADVWFVPTDPRAADAALLAARPIADVAPRSPITSGLRRFVGEAVAPVSTQKRVARRGRRRVPEPVLP
ncbi:MAG TPA: P-loop NTPase [Microbacterium sp.]|nr:P-loop NTPase [Microbacterium sp.]